MASGSLRHPALLRRDQPALFNGSAYDPEDGPLADDSLSWESDRDGVLGSDGELVEFTLSPGGHEITLAATDSARQRGLASVRIFVGYAVYLPVVLKTLW